MLPTMVYSHITLQSPPSERASHRGTKKSLSEEKANILLIKCYFFIFQIENNNKPVYAVSSLPSVSTSLQQAIEQEIIQSSSSSSPAPQIQVTSSAPATHQQTPNRSSNVAVQIPGLPLGTVLVPPGNTVFFSTKSRNSY